MGIFSGRKHEHIDWSAGYISQIAEFFGWTTDKQDGTAVVRSAGSVWSSSINHTGGGLYARARVAPRTLYPLSRGPDWAQAQSHSQTLRLMRRCGACAQRKKGGVLCVLVAVFPRKRPCLARGRRSFLNGLTKKRGVFLGTKIGLFVMSPGISFFLWTVPSSQWVPVKT